MRKVQFFGLHGLNAIVKKFSHVKDQEKWHLDYGDKFSFGGT